ncbi:MAG: DJ-1/PfpI family protein [Bacteroidales bacterium]|jgi:4-methyl-5(b-hydroxyethyl)-thiazole monophosphate biosynthesis|nr:DJ-1/PfpI family protein [Bacteroidales bacterium]
MKDINSVGVCLITGFEEVEALMQIDILRRAGFSVRTISLTGKDTVTGQQKVTAKADILFEDVDFDSIDMLILPGGGLGVINMHSHEGLHKVILRFDELRKPIAAICAAPTLLGSLGLLEGRSATCYPGMESKLTGADVSSAQVVIDGHIITSRSVGTALYMAITIIEICKGFDAAKKIAAAIDASLSFLTYRQSRPDQPFSLRYPDGQCLIEMNYKK